MCCRCIDMLVLLIYERCMMYARGLKLVVRALEMLDSMCRMLLCMLEHMEDEFFLL